MSVVVVPCCGHAILFITLKKLIHCKKRTVLFRVIAQKVVLIPYRRFGTSYRSHLQEPRIQKRLWNYHYLLHNNTEECSSYLLRGGSLKSCLYIATFITYVRKAIQLDMNMFQTPV